MDELLSEEIRLYINNLEYELEDMWNKLNNGEFYKIDVDWLKHDHNGERYMQFGNWSIS